MLEMLEGLFVGLELLGCVVFCGYELVLEGG